jgi:hypothetical protein
MECGAKVFAAQAATISSLATSTPMSSGVCIGVHSGYKVKDAGVDTHRRKLAFKSAVRVFAHPAARFLIDVGSVGWRFLSESVRNAADNRRSPSTPALLSFPKKSYSNHTSRRAVADQAGGCRRALGEFRASVRNPRKFAPTVVGRFEARARVAQPPCLVEQRRGPHEVTRWRRRTGALFFGDFILGEQKKGTRPRQGTVRLGGKSEG